MQLLCVALVRHYQAVINCRLYFWPRTHHHQWNKSRNVTIFHVHSVVDAGQHLDQDSRVEVDARLVEELHSTATGGSAGERVVQIDLFYVSGQNVIESGFGQSENRKSRLIRKRNLRS